MQGRNGWNSITAIWVNPPASVKRRSVRLLLAGAQFGPAHTARRVGHTVSHTWPAFEQDTDVKVCVRFAGVNRVACDRTMYIGSRP
ncbi:hypothetical protein ABZ527_31800 [Streptomyces griseofuscus]|uniref:hypothetical protein n=1 Tax=Streptomyces griseofuscus TaxID=146922 RepID=UPI0033FAD92B